METPDLFPIDTLFDLRMKIAREDQTQLTLDQRTAALTQTRELFDDLQDLEHDLDLRPEVYHQKFGEEVTEQARKLIPQLRAALVNRRNAIFLIDRHKTPQAT